MYVPHLYTLPLICGVDIVLTRDQIALCCCLCRLIFIIPYTFNALLLVNLIIIYIQIHNIYTQKKLFVNNYCSLSNNNLKYLYNYFLNIY